jgi:hypothetical protein
MAEAYYEDIRIVNEKFRRSIPDLRCSHPFLLNETPEAERL